MEESEKRRERLRAMRMEAAQAEVSSNIGASASYGSLSNPLIETSTVPQGQEEFRAPPRFDFYTDPMSAFSANRKRGNIGASYPETSPRPTYQFQNSDSPNHGAYVGRGFSYYNSPSGSPAAMPRPFAMNQGSPEFQSGPGNAFNYSYPTHQARGNFFSPEPRPMPSCPMNQGTPEFQSGPGNAFNYSYPTPQARGNFFSPEPRPMPSPFFHTPQGQTPLLGHSPSQSSGHTPSPSPSSGQGRDHWIGSSMSPAYGRGRGRGPSRLGNSSGDRALGREGLYNKSMLEDPWFFLEPVLWKSSSASSNDATKPNSSKSVNTKRPRVSDSSNQSDSQPSLAEFLAASLNEAINDAPGT